MREPSKDLLGGGDVEVLEKMRSMLPRSACPDIGEYMESPIVVYHYVDAA